VFLKNEKKYPSLREEFVANLNKRFEEENVKKSSQKKILDDKEIKNKSSFF
jgi:hypothetical protein